jgi:predicted RNA-binding protein
MFPSPRTPFDLYDEKNTYLVEVDEQFRLRFPKWLKNHPEIKADDEVVLLKENGIFGIRLARAMTNKSVSLKDLLGKDIKEGKIVDVQQTPGGTVAIVQSTKEIPIDTVLAEV